MFYSEAKAFELKHGKDVKYIWLGKKIRGRTYECSK